MNIYRYIASAALFVLTAAISCAGTKGDGKVRFAYDAGFEMNFDNREYSKSDFSKSMTIFGARLAPSVGISIPQRDKDMNHRLMLGIDIMKNFGGPQKNADLFQEMTLYYKLDKRSEKTRLELYAGIFPRKAMGGSYSDAFFSDSLKFYDNNLEGLLIKIHRPKSYYEVGCDWIGQKGYERKEKFMVYSAGESSITSWFKVGYAGYMYHFAGSQKARGVVDNILLNPYVRFDVGHKMSLQEFSLRLGWLQSMQNDREFVGHYVFPRGGEFDLAIRKWNIGIHNRFFYGTDMMPYYNSTDTAGDKYGTRLYFGDPFYRIHDDYPRTYAGLYNRLDVFYEPHIGRYLKIRISARFHFHDSGYSGCQQVVSLLFNLNNNDN